MKVKRKEHTTPSGPGGGFTSGETLSRDEFIKAIKSAEKGPFYSVQESMNQFEKWIKEREKK